MKRTVSGNRPMADLQHALTLSPTETARYIGRSVAYVYVLMAEDILHPVSDRPKLVMRTEVEAVAANGFQAVGVRA